MDLFFIAVLSLGSMIGLGIFVCWVVDKFRDRTNPADEKKAQEEYKRERALLPSPDFEALEKHFGQVPNEFRVLYEKQELILREGFYFVSETDPENYDYIQCFLPAHLSSLDAMWFLDNAVRDKHVWLKLKADYFPIADDGGGNLYVVDMKSSKTQCAVYFLDHEMFDDPSHCADSLLEWVSRPTRDDLESE